MKKEETHWNNLDWCSAFENKLETFRILNIIGTSLTEKGEQTKKDLQKWIDDNMDKYLSLTIKK